MEKWALIIMGLVCLFVAVLQNRYFEGFLIAGVFIGAACICKKLEEIRDK